MSQPCSGQISILTWNPLPTPSPFGEGRGEGPMSKIPQSSCSFCPLAARYRALKTDHSTDQKREVLGSSRTTPSPQPSPKGRGSITSPAQLSSAAYPAVIPETSDGATCHAVSIR